MSEELEKLLAKKKVEEAKLEIADKQNNLFLCLAIADTLNEIDKKIREIATKEELEVLHSKGLI